MNLVLSRSSLAVLSVLILSALCAGADLAYGPSPVPWRHRRSAEGGFEILMTRRVDLGDALELRVSPDCAQTPLVAGGVLDAGSQEMGLEDLARATIEAGLGELQAWSPELVSRIVASVRGRSLLLSCERLSTGDLAQHRQEVRPASLFRRAKVLREWLVLPSVAQAAADGLALSGNLKRTDAAERYARWYKDLMAEKRWDYGLELRQEQNNLFHEFLHFAGMEMDPDHNTLIDQRANRRQLDRVFSCAALAFPSDLSPVALDRSAATARPIALTAQACRTCVGADSPKAGNCAEFPEGPPPNYPGQTFLGRRRH